MSKWGEIHGFRQMDEDMFHDLMEFYGIFC